MQGREVVEDRRDAADQADDLSDQEKPKPTAAAARGDGLREQSQDAAEPFGRAGCGG